MSESESAVPMSESVSAVPASDRDLAMYLRPEQLVAGTSQPVPRRQVGPWASVGLWALRMFVIVLSLMVIYTFAVQVVS